METNNCLKVIILPCKMEYSLSSYAFITTNIINNYHKWPKTVVNFSSSQNDSLENNCFAKRHGCIYRVFCSETSCKFLRLVTQSFFGLFSVFWAFLHHKLWAIFHSSTSGTWNWKKRLINLRLKKGKISGMAQIGIFSDFNFFGFLSIASFITMQI